jgi:hypothetical protein
MQTNYNLPHYYNLTLSTISDDQFQLFFYFLKDFIAFSLYANIKGED